MVIRLRWFAVALPGLLMTGLLEAAEPRWTPLGPPQVPPAARLVLDPASGARQYALTAAGLWRSQNGGVSWRSVQEGLDGPPQAVAVDPAHPGTLYAAIQEFDESGTLRRSDDFGDHWRVVFRSHQRTESQALYFDPSDPVSLFWSRDGRMERSRDGGRTWSCFAGVDGCGTTVEALAFAPGRPGTIYVAGAGQFSSSADGGRTWSRPSLNGTGFSPDVLVATPEPRTLYAWLSDSFYRGSGSTPCFARSDDEGETWKPILRATRCGAPAIDPEDPRTVRIVVVAEGAPRLWVSHDGGDHWSTAGDAPSFGDLYVTAGGRLELASSHGLFQAPGEAGPWRAANRGFAASEIAALLPLEHGLLAAPVLQIFTGGDPALPLLGTRDEGHSWNSLPLVNPIALAPDPNDPRHLIASARRAAPDIVHNRVLESRDEGDTWSGILGSRIDPPLLLVLAIDPFDPRIFYGGTDHGGFYRSLDGGRTWQAANAGLPLEGCHVHHCETNWVRSIFPDPKQEGRLVIHFEEQVYESLDRGAHWNPRGPALPRKGKVTILARDPEGTLVAIGSGAQRGDADSLGVVYRSADGGETWTRAGRLPKAPTPARATALTGLLATRAGLFVGTDSLGVLWSPDGGRLWKSLNAGLPSLWINALAADPSDPARLYAAVSMNGVYSIRMP